MKVGKPKSKRVPVRLRHKIQKASAAKQRKNRKEEKTNPQWRSRLKKDPGIPNLFPYKAKILAEIEETKRRKEEEQMQKRELAKAQREGRAVEAQAALAGQTIEDEDLLDEDDDDEEEEEEEEEGGITVDDDGDQEMQQDSNPMAALFASAQAMAQNYQPKDDEGSSEDEDEDEDEREVDGIPSTTKAVTTTKKALPKRALEDPIKAVTLLMTKMQDTPNGVQTLLDHYQIPPLVNTGSDISTRTLVEVARKRGRLGRGGVPNLHAAALIVLSDLHEQRLRLPAAQTTSTSTAKGEVTIVKTMAAPFRLEGLWGDSTTNKALATEMAIDA